MEDNKYYMLTFTEWDYEWEEEKNYFFKTEKEAKEYKTLLLKQNTRYSNKATINEISFEEMKELITVEEFEELFDITINDPRTIYDYDEEN